MTRKQLFYPALALAVIVTLIASIFIYKRMQIQHITQQYTQKAHLEYGKKIAADIDRLRSLANDPNFPDLKPKYQVTIAARQEELRKLGVDKDFPEAMK
ncbi:hypothetical protein DB346_10085 [Verrucomicrobia bacterium LW23]|nr:hypothetical protein DB346_10085 [Verrucomicrobia bacterium LW23]